MELNFLLDSLQFIQFCSSTNIFQKSAKVSMIWILWPVLPHPLYVFPGHHTLATESDQLLLGLPWHTHAPGHLHGWSHSRKALPPDVTWITASFLMTFNFSGRSLIKISKIWTPSSTCVIFPSPASLFLFDLYCALTHQMHLFSVGFVFWLWTPPGWGFLSNMFTAVNSAPSECLAYRWFSINTYRMNTAILLE